jgi:hypothetical protein
LKLILSTACVLLSVAALADTANAQLTADQLLESVVSQLPTTPLHVSGELLVRKRRGVPVATFGFTLDAHWGAKPAHATYTIQDAFGRPLEQLTISHGQSTSYRYAVGDPLQEAPLKAQSLPIQNTDLSWTDLTLAFLWWPGAKHVGEESIRTFDCRIIEVQAPSATSPQPLAHSLLSPYAKVRLWISKKAHMMLQAEGYDEEGNIKRRLWVRSVKKINDQWMIKDMEVQHYPVLHRTKLRIIDVETPTEQTAAITELPEVQNMTDHKPTVTTTP